MVWVVVAWKTTPRLTFQKSLLLVVCTDPKVSFGGTNAICARASAAIDQSTMVATASRASLDLELLRTTIHPMP